MIISSLIVGGLALEGYRRFRNKKKKTALVTQLTNSTQKIVSTNRQQQLADITEAVSEMSPEERDLNKKSMLFLTSFGVVATATLMNPVLAILNLPIALYILKDVYIGSYCALAKKKLNVDTLVAVLNTLLLVKGMYFMCNLYLMLYLLNRKLMLKLKDQSSNSIIDVFKQQPRTVWVLVDNVETEIAFEAIKQDDIVVVNAGEKIPVDGTVNKGMATVDQHLLTGESQPVEKEINDQVFAMTIVLAGRIEVCVDKAGDETTVAHIGQILNQTVNAKTEHQSWSENLTDKTVLPTFILTSIAWPILGPTSAMIVLNSHFRYRLTIVTSTSVLNFLNLAAKKGILIKSGQSLEALKTIDTVVFDKTGTLTIEQPHVGSIYYEPNYDENTILSYAAAAEEKQTHPIATAILEEATQRALSLPTLGQTEYRIGYGINVSMGKHQLRVGSERFMHMENCTVSNMMQHVQKRSHEQGHSMVMIALDDQVIGAIELHITLRPEAQSIINALHERDIATYIISGDQEIPTKKLAEQLAIDHYYAEVLPEKKASLITELQQQGRSVCYVGDGINDSIALKQANVSVSLCGASSIAVDTAHVILMDGTLNQLSELFTLSQAFEDNMRLTSTGVIVPCFINFGGAFFSEFTLIHSMLLSAISVFTGFSSAMLPLMKHKEEQTLHIGYERKESTTTH